MKIRYRTRKIVDYRLYVSETVQTKFSLYQQAGGTSSLEDFKQGGKVQIIPIYEEEQDKEDK